MGWGAGRNEAVVTEGDDWGLGRFEHSENCRGRRRNQSCRHTRTDALTGVGVTGWLRWGSVVLMVDRSLCLGRA
jgi:hypothetical protein